MTARSNRKEYQAMWRAKNKDKVRAASKRHYDKNKDDPLFKQKQFEVQRNVRQKAQFTPKIFVSKMLGAAKGRAKKHNLEFNIDKLYLNNLLESSRGKCSATNLNMSTMYNCPFKASLDRIDSNKGYVKGNVRIVTTIFNYMKQDYTDEQFSLVAKAFIKNNGLQKIRK